MKKTFITALMAALLSAGTSTGASALTVTKPVQAVQQSTGAKVELVKKRHGGNFRRHILPGHVVRHKLRRQGYRHIRQVGLYRGDYIFMARGYRGRVKLVVDGRTGHVISRHRLNRRSGHGFRHRNGNFSFSLGLH